MAKDYKSFASIAKTRFRAMAQTLGYEQVTGVFYTKQISDWYESFSLQASSYGNDFFYFNYGIQIPHLWPPFDREYELKNAGYIIARRLTHADDQGFGNATRAEVEQSAELALQCYREQALPWFVGFDSFKDIAEAYFHSVNLDKHGLGKHTPEAALSAANYGLLLRLAGERKTAIDWLKEAERLLTLPLYATRDGRIVHTREPQARIMKPDADDLATLERIRAAINADISR